MHQLATREILHGREKMRLAKWEARMWSFAVEKRPPHLSSEFLSTPPKREKKGPGRRNLRRINTTNHLPTTPPNPLIINKQPSRLHIFPPIRRRKLNTKISHRSIPSLPAQLIQRITSLSNVKISRSKRSEFRSGRWSRQNFAITTMRQYFQGARGGGRKEGLKHQKERL